MFASILSEIAQLRTNYPILSPALLIFIGLQVYYRLVVVKPIQLHCKRNSLYHVSSITYIYFDVNKLEINFMNNTDNKTFCLFRNFFKAIYLYSKKHTFPPFGVLNLACKQFWPLSYAEHYLTSTIDAR